MRMSMVWIIALAALVALGYVYSEMAARRFERNAPPVGRFVDVALGRAHVLDIGPLDTGLPPVILIHGATVNLRDQAMSLGEPLARERRVVIVDRPGHGYSSRPAEGWCLDRQATFIQQVATALELERPVVVGQSFGGAVALAYALRYQADLSGLVVLAGVSHEWPGGVAWYNDASDTPVLGWALRRLVLPWYGPITAKDGYPESFAPGTPPADYVSRAGVMLLFRPADFAANAEDNVNLKREIIAQQGRYGELTLPVEIVTGDQDTSVSPDIHSRTLAREVAGASLTILPGVGHALHHTATDAVLGSIRRVGATAASADAAPAPAQDAAAASAPGD